MLFNSIEFAFFLPIVFAIYWIIGYLRISEALKLRLQNAFVLIASYVFYGWWDWRFLLLIVFTSFCSWGSGWLIQEAATQVKAKVWSAANIIVNLVILGVFKYYDFFVSEFGQLFGINTDSLLLRIILPVGISFYTFQALSYSIDIYCKKINPTEDIIAFFTYIAFFPQLVAGPIERATNLLPQFLTNRKFSYDQGIDGVRQIVWGFFKKVVIADNCATYVDQVWAQHDVAGSGALLLAAVLFAIQIYGDFSGYSDIAIGTAKLFGIKLMRNFNNPYFSRDIAEFWRRWHISLTTWFRDYLYIPLGGSRVEKWKIVRNTFVIFLVCGIWHGANWTFLAWGAFHALLFLPLIMLGKNRKYTDQIAVNRLFPSWKEVLQMLATFILVVIGWIFFRAGTVTQAWEYLCGIVIPNKDVIPFIMHSWEYIPLIVTILFMFVIEWLNRGEEHGFALQRTISHKWVRRLLYICVSLAIVYWGNLSSEEFIYFQF